MHYRLLASLLPIGLIVATASAQTPIGTPLANGAATFAGTGIPNDHLMNYFANGTVLSIGAQARCSGDLPWDGAGTYYASAGRYVPGTLGCSDQNWATWSFNFYINDAGNLNNYGLFYELTPGGPFGEVFIPGTALVGGPYSNASGHPADGIAENSWNLSMGFLSGIPVTAGVTPPAGLFNYNAPGEYQFGLLLVGANGNPLYDQNHALEGASMIVDVTPEPATLVLLGTGLLGIGGVIRRRRKTQSV